MFDPDLSSKKGIQKVSRDESSITVGEKMSVDVPEILIRRPNWIQKAIDPAAKAFDLAERTIYSKGYLDCAQASVDEVVHTRQQMHEANKYQASLMAAARKTMLHRQARLADQMSKLQSVVAAGHNTAGCLESLQATNLSSATKELLTAMVEADLGHTAQVLLQSFLDARA